MNQNDFRPAGQFAAQFGVKSLVYGPPGVGKTPIINTAPRPVLIATEPGLLSMRGSNVPTWAAFTPKAIDDFFDWLFTSHESRNYDTVCVDSTSQTAEIYLEQAHKTNRDGRAAYGEMSRNVMKHLSRLYFMPYKHTYLICKMERSDGVVRPFFPGKDLNVKVPHLYDVILHCDTQTIPQYGQHKAFRTNAIYGVVARDRTGKLSEFEPCDLAALFAKAMS